MLSTNRKKRMVRCLHCTQPTLVRRLTLLKCESYQEYALSTAQCGPTMEGEKEGGGGGRLSRGRRRLA